MKLLRPISLILLLGFARLGAAEVAMPLTELTAGMYRIEAEVAHTFETRQVGLMNRAAMPLHRGMVFVFPEARAHCMWMKNTPLPLSIAFLDDDGTVVNIADMAPRSETTHCPKAAVRYALEMEQGWFDHKGVGAGQRIGGLPGRH